MIKQILGKLPRKQSSKQPQGLPNGNDSPAVVSLNSTLYADNGKLKNPTKSGTVSSINGINTSTKSRTPVPSVGPTQINYVAASESLPSLRDVSSSERHNLFIRKLNLCSVVFDFTDLNSNLNEKDAKRKMLLELVNYVSSVNTKFNEAAMQEIAKMVSANLFRGLHSSNHEGRQSLGDVYDPEDGEPSMDLAWPHLQIVYEFLLRFVISSETDAKLAKRYIDHPFMLRLLELFDSEDQREREYLKTILHRIYGKFMVHRPFIRKAINNIFYQFVFETENHNGIAQLLEILGSIINGFALPLKEEHKHFLVRALIPLHKLKCMQMYHQQLSYCIVQFVEKDFKLADTVIRGLLKYWPLTNSAKEVLFLGELEEVLEATQPAEFQRCMVPLSRRIARCLNSSHFQVAERALFLWNNDHVRSLTVTNRKVILPILLIALERNALGHWNQAVRGLTLNVSKIFSDADPLLFEECLAKFEEDETKENEMLNREEATWKRIEAAASSKSVKSCEGDDLVSVFQSSLAISTSPNQKTSH